MLTDLQILLLADGRPMYEILKEINIAEGNLKMALCRLRCNGFDIRGGKKMPVTCYTPIDREEIRIAIKWLKRIREVKHRI